MGFALERKQDQIRGNETDLNLNNNIKLEGCEYYGYLEADINRDGRDSHEIKSKICRGRKAVKLLNSIWWSEEISRKKKCNT